MRLILIMSAVVILLCGKASAAETFPKLEELTSICLITTNVEICEATRDGFAEDWENAKNGDVQAQRSVAYCLLTGCDGATVALAVEACAWRMIIQAAGRELQETDDQNYRFACILSAQSRRKALDRAQSMYRAIYRKEMPLEGLQRK